LAIGSDLGSGHRGHLVEDEHTTRQVFREHAVERTFETGAASSFRQQRKAESRLEHSDAREPHRLGGLAIQPLYDYGVRIRLHQRRQHLHGLDEILPEPPIIRRFYAPARLELEFALQQLRRQLEVNVVGQIAVTQAVLPLLRRAHGRIVNMGSIAGRGTIPMMGPYSASKYALEALTDALRLELYPWGIEVSIIEPGAIATPIWDKSMQISQDVESEMPVECKHLYEAAAQSIRESVGQAAARAIPVDAVVEAVLHALTAKRPKTRYLVGRDAKLRAVMVKWLPDRFQDWIQKKALNLPVTRI
jgi:NAD(P)-dependent dehydrogenase (short-subunit alcohol dehydrogenase family)